MDDLISRQAAITLPIMPKEYRKHKPIDCDDAYEQGWGDCQSCIGCLPTAEPSVATMNLEVDKESLRKAMEEAELTLVAEPRKGKWIYGEDDGQDGWFCSECGRFIPWDYDYYGLDNIDFITDYKTCPFCDAKMITYTGAKMEET